jgi:hypothetical protein
MKKNITSEELEVYKARLAKWEPCKYCNIVCYSAWGFWCTGAAIFAYSLLSRGWFTFGGWMLAMGLLGAASWNCKIYTEPLNFPDDDD